MSTVPPGAASPDRSQAPDDARFDLLARQLDAAAELAGSSSARVPEAGSEAGPARGPDTGPETRFAASVIAQLREPGTWTAPPADLRAGVLAAALAAVPQPVRSEVEPASPATRHQPEPNVVRPMPNRWRRLSWAVPAAAAAAVVISIGAIGADRALRDSTGPGVTYTAEGTPLSAGASAKVTVAAAAGGFSIVVDPHDLTPAARGSYYAAWLKGPRGSVPLGSFHARTTGEPITLWSGVDPRDYPTFTVTLQQEGRPAVPPGPLVLKAALTGADLP